MAFHLKELDKLSERFLQEKFPISIYKFVSVMQLNHLVPALHIGYGEPWWEIGGP